MAAAKKTYTATCIDCQRTMTMPRKPPAGGISCGQCPSDAHNARVAAANEAARVARNERRAAIRRGEVTPARRVAVPAGEWGYIVGLNRAMHRAAREAEGK